MAAYPWVLDPAKEPPTYGRESFLEIECGRARALCAGEVRGREERARYVKKMKQAAGKTPLLAIVIPDEFQVEDPLFAEVAARLGGSLDRDAPQKIIAELLERLAIPYVDLLPLLRAVPPGAHGADEK